MEPNSYDTWTESPAGHQPQQAGGDIYRYDFREDDEDYYTQPGQLFRAMTEDQRRVLCENTARNMGDSTLQIKHRHIANCYQADPAYGEGVARALNIKLEEVDLNLPRRDSRQGNHLANNRHPELNVPHVSAVPQDEIKTDYNPLDFIDPMKDPFVL